MPQGAGHPVSASLLSCAFQVPTWQQVKKSMSTEEKSGSEKVEWGQRKVSVGQQYLRTRAGQSDLDTCPPTGNSSHGQRCGPVSGGSTHGWPQTAEQVGV